MSYLFIGVGLLIASILFMRMAFRDKDKEGIIGLAAIILAALILIVFFGLFFQVVMN